MAIERQDEIKTYLRTTAQVKTAVGAGAGETIQAVTLVDGITILTTEGTNPQQQRWYRISQVDARSMLGLANGEVFDSIELGADVTIKTRKRVI